MAKPKRNAKGRFVKAKAVTRRRRRRTVAAVAAPARKRTYRRRRKVTARRGRAFGKVLRARRGNVVLVNRRRRYRRNPIAGSLSFNQDTLKSVGLTVGGFIGVPFVEGFAMSYLPAALTGNKFGKYAVKIGAAIALSMLVGKFVSREAGKKVGMGGLAYVGVSIVKDFLPQVMAPGTGAYMGVSGMGNQPLLGAYMPAMGSAITRNAPARLQPQSRY